MYLLLLLKRKKFDVIFECYLEELEFVVKLFLYSKLVNVWEGKV